MSAVHPGTPPGSPPATVTPGQAAREAFGELGADWYPGTPWNKLHEDLRAQWDAAAQAAIEAAPGDLVTLTGALADLAITRRERDEARADRQHLRRDRDDAVRRGAAMAAENAELQAAVNGLSEKLEAISGAARDFADTWAELLMSLPDSYACHMTCGEANAAADLFRVLGRDDEAGLIVAAHVEHDDDDEATTHAALEPRP